ncbi:MAG: alpha/beta hydrolase fold domain-containing protein [Lachnospiraceae bacterium]|nr:alpha/beta hydrolase fold domain-containing protein [Lachnospiraceae bacterium]
MELSERQKKKLMEAMKAEMIKQAHGILIADKMIKVSGKRIKLPLEGRELDAVYYPAFKEDGSVESELCPLIVGFHGGGFLFGGCAVNDAMWVAVTKSLHCNVVSVGYRQSPEYDWHVCLKDSADAALYLQKHAEEFFSLPGFIYLMGQSAGANLAAAVCLKYNLDRLHLSPGEGFDDITLDSEEAPHILNCIMLYPQLDGATPPDEKGSGTLAGPVCTIFNELHCNDGNEKNPLVSPTYATSEMLPGLPNTIIVYSENDNLRTEAMNYAKMLREADVPVSEMLAEGMPHGYFESGFKIPTSFEMEFLGENAQELVDSGALHEWSVKTLEFIKENLSI